MASPLRLTVCKPVNDSPSWATAAERAWAGVRAEFEAAEEALSRFRGSSDLTRLNAVAGADATVWVPRRLERALVAADRAWRITGGIFDPRVLADLERLGEHGADLPATAAARRFDVGDDSTDTGARIVERSARHHVRVRRPIDLGGIGKGLALRWATTVLVREHLEGFLLDAGGDIVARGPGPEGGPWLVGIEDPNGAPDALAAMALGDGAVATSSIGRRRWTHEGRVVHHLLDPRTSEPAASGLQAVTVAADDPAWAEVWSKTLFIGGRAAIGAAARRRGLAAWWVTMDGELEMTPAARSRTVWVAGEAARG